MRRVFGRFRVPQHVLVVFAKDFIRLLLPPESNEIFRKYYEDVLRDPETSENTLHTLFSNELLWHIFLGDVSDLNKEKSGATHIRRNTLYGDNPIGFLRTGRRSMTTSQCIAANINNQPIERNRARETPLYHLYAAKNIKRAWLHTITKLPLVGTFHNTFLCVGIGPNCPAYKHFGPFGVIDCDRQSECDVILLDANGDPGPGILVAVRGDESHLLYANHP